MFAYTRRSLSPQQVMFRVWLALLPGTVLYVWLFGWGVVINLLAACASATASEALMLYWRKTSLKPFIFDGSGVITAWIIALALPPCLPWWVAAVGAAIAIIVGKQLYGGLGNNLFNPAMVGYAAILVAFPLHLTVWPGAEWAAQGFDFTEAISCALNGTPAAEVTSGATPLSAWRAGYATDGTVIPDWYRLNAAFLAGGIWLLWQRLILWHVPVSMLAAIALGSGILHLVDSTYPTPDFHLLSGATMIGAFFVATDPVTAPRLRPAMLIFGAGTGLLLLTFRTTGSFIDGLAFAVLLMNMLTPLLDRC